MMFIYFAILAACFYVGYTTGKNVERETIKRELQQQSAFLEQLEDEKKKAADETRKQLKFEADERKKIRKQIEQEERDKP